MIFPFPFNLNTFLLWKVTSSHCRAKKRWREKVLLSELLWSRGQVTRRASACIYLTRTVSSLQESVVENTGEGGVAQGHPATASAIQLSLHNEDDWEGKIRWGDFSRRGGGQHWILGQSRLKKKTCRNGERQWKKETVERQLRRTAERNCSMQECFLGGGQGALLSDWMEVETLFCRWKGVKGRELGA